MEKLKVSQDFLYKQLMEHNVIISLLAKRMGVSVAIVSRCFHRDLNRHGKPLSFTGANIVKLNAALEELAAEIRQSTVDFGSDQTYTNQRGATYDPATVEPLRRLSAYFKMNPFLQRVLGWRVSKRETILGTPSSKAYGCVSQDDVARVNAELLAVAGVLSGLEVVADGDGQNKE